MKKWYMWLYHIQIYTGYAAGFYCDPKYKSVTCNEVSLKAYLNGDCGNGSYVELRVITDECIYAGGENMFHQLECDGSSATMSLYYSGNGVCSDTTLVNTTSLSNERDDDVDGEDIGCMVVEGCDAASTGDSTRDSSSTVAYIIITVIAVVIIAILDLSSHTCMLTDVIYAALW